LAKVALELEDALRRRAHEGAPGTATGRVLACGEGWRADDVVCTSGPEDRVFEEQHAQHSIAVVVAGSFQYRTRHGEALLTPGALLLGNAGHSFECAHEHGRGDRCVAFHYEPEFFARAISDAGVRGSTFGLGVLPPLRGTALPVALTHAGLELSAPISWEETALELLAASAQSTSAKIRRAAPPPRSIARVSELVRAVERTVELPESLEQMAASVYLSPYHFLRTFRRVTGTTPHQYLLRLRLRRAAQLVLDGPSNLVDVALQCGFGEAANFTNAFRAEFGCAPSVLAKKT
jgi:AraC-like DNA-binding protein